jgi:serine/threonine protein kinase
MRPCPSCGKLCDETHKFCPSCGFPISQVQHDSGDALVGKTLPGGYVVLEPIGTGGMGRVYRGEQSALGRTVAVKVVHQHLLGDENTAARFVTEARAASRLNHPNSVAVIDFGKTDDGQLYLVMEFLRGRDLAHILHTESPMPFRRTLNVLRQVLAALAQAHDLGIIHRDLKPENVILEPGRGGADFVKVVDFGLAKILEQNGGENLTRPGIVCGTPDYMAPEQGRGDPIDARTDLYAVGIILYACLTGRLPFEAEAPTQVVLMHLTIPAPDPRATSPERRIPNELAEVCLKALEKDPAARFQDADSFSAALGQIQETLERAAKAKPASIECGSCGYANPKAQKFCGECGAKLAAPISGDGVAVSVPPPTLPAHEGSSVPPPATSGRMGQTALPLPLLHRADDLAWLEDRRSEVRTALVGARIVGEDGAGKTRLLEEFLTIARAAGDHVVTGGPDPFWAGVGYWTLRQIISNLIGVGMDGGTREWTGASAEARQGLDAIFGGADESSTLRAEERRYSAAEALRWAITRGVLVAGRHRVIIVVDDLNRVDGVSRLALADVVGEPPLAPVLLLATHTPGVEVGWGAQASARILPGLPKQVAANVLRAKSRSHSSDPGHRGLPPMYVEQLVRFSREGGTEPPRRLADIVSLRVERLDPAARRILQGLAVTGDDTRDARLEQVLKLPGSALAEPRAHLLESGMIVARGATSSISHPLLREIVAASTPAAVRRELHTAALSGEGDSLPLEARAQHAFLAQDTFEALLLLEQMADLARLRGDSEGAVLALRRALDLARREFFRGELDDPARAVLIFSRKLGEALVDAGAFTDADGVLREALDLAGPAGVERARVLGALAIVAYRRSRAVEAESYLAEAVEVARRTGEPEVLASVEELRERMARQAPSFAPPA